LRNHEQLKKETNSFAELPKINNVSTQMVNENYMQIKKEVARIIETEIERILNTPGMENLMP
jgi:hypothetical protein